MLLTAFDLNIVNRISVSAGDNFCLMSSLDDNFEYHSSFLHEKQTKHTNFWSFFVANFIDCGKCWLTNKSMIVQLRNILVKFAEQSAAINQVSTQ